MISLQSPSVRRCLAAIVSPTILFLSGWSSAPERFVSPAAGHISVNFPQSSSDRGAPARTAGAGSRGNTCDSSSEMQAEDASLTALTPQNNILKTVSPNPSLYLYVPPVKEKEAVFQVIDKQTEEIVYATTLTLNNRTASILKLSLPKDVQLKPDVTYHWGFFIICNPDDELQDEGIEGWIEVASLNAEIEQQLQRLKQDPIAQAKLYAQSGAWNETIALLAKQRDSHPQEWLELLKSVDLPEGVVNHPILDSEN